MDMKKNRGNLLAGIGVILLLAVIAADLLLSGAGNQQTQEGPAQIMENGGETMTLEEYIMSLLDCTDTQAESIRTTFEKVTGRTIQTLGLVPTDTKSRTVEVLAGGSTYYMKVSSSGLLREIRQDSQTGKIIYQVVY